MSLHRLSEVDDDVARVDPAGTQFWILRRDPVEPVPVGTYIATVFRVTGFDPDCDGSLMARLEHVDRNGSPTGWETTHHGLYVDSGVVLDGPGDLHDLLPGESEAERTTNALR